MATNAEKRVTLADVAKLAGVSKQTVSRVINDSEHVTPETRDRVMQCIEVLGFRPSALARQLSSGRSFTLGIVSCGGFGYLASGVAHVGMVRQADKMGYALLTKELTDFSPGTIRTMLDYMAERQVDGLIWAGPEMGDSHVWLNDFDPASLSMPIVVVNAQVRGKIDTVAFDNFEAGRVATQHLISLGRKRIGHISGPMSRWVARQRVDGWRSALDEAGLSECKEFFAEGDWEPGTGGPGLHHLLELCPKLDAVFVGSDRMALGALHEAHRVGLRIPDDIAVIGIDNAPESEFMIPPLSTMTQDTPAMAERALRLLVRRICERRGEPYPPECEQAEEPHMHHTLVLRESTLGAKR